MERATWKRFLLGLLQHLAAMGIALCVAGILFNSCLTVETMNGTQTYDLSPMDTESEFEDTEVFRDIFRGAVSDVMRLVVIKGYMETGDVFDPEKSIDITQYAGRMGNGNGCNTTAVYVLEDLIKWGRYGIEYGNRSMSMSEFVNYFGSTISPDYFALDASGVLYFAGFEGNGGGQDTELVQAQMEKYAQAQLEDMVFSYILAETSADISVAREEDGTLTVHFPLISCRYDTVDGEGQLIKYAENWVDYMKLQYNLVESINGLTTAYEQYQRSNYLYLESKSNLKYVIRMQREDGRLITHTNVSDMENAEESDITDFFAEYRRYLIYYPDSLEFTGNTSMSEEEIYELLNEYEYAYPETTHIWMGVDTEYPIEGDVFYKANTVFQRIVPYSGYIVALCAALGVLWVALGVYLTVTAGAVRGDEVSCRLNGFDCIWTELAAAAIMVFVYAAVVVWHRLVDITETVYLSQAEFMTEGMAGLYEYGCFAAFGFGVSMFTGLFWYSLVRRIRCQNLWSDSFCRWMIGAFRRGIWFVLSHRSTAVSILIPYNFFLLINLLGILFTYINWNKGARGYLLMIVLVAVDGVVGMMVFKNRAEQIDIVEGIRRIRDGEVDYKLDVDTLHGDNREMADAVNNIGEGIRKAVRTSMKDEQMRTDLITNVSHDIKTPLTSIINYVDLLKRLGIREEPIKSYIEVLDNKSQRLKQLADDLVEASKISSGNIELNQEKLNLAELLHQAIGEFSEKLEGRKLEVVYSGGELVANILADSRRMWRVTENLFNNICNYALEGTRIYVDLTVEKGRVEVSIKNISARQMNISAEELTERFIRGDSARSTEGSGLGLSIAQSLTQVQGGEFTIHLDGDLFKVVLAFAEYVPETEA